VSYDREASGSTHISVDRQVHVHPSSLLQWGPLQWPSGSEESYMDVMRWGGLVGAVLTVLLVIVGVTR
jgi:hypothetical protein